MSTLICPRRHAEADDLDAISHVEELAGVTSWDAARDIILRAGYCPACPQEKLADESVELFSRARTAGRCGCCGGLWVPDEPQGWTLLDRGRLREETRGRPAVGPRIDVRLGDLLSQVDAWAAEHGVKRAEAVRRLVAKGLGDGAR